MVEEGKSARELERLESPTGSGERSPGSAHKMGSTYTALEKHKVTHLVWSYCNLFSECGLPLFH